MLVRHAEPLRLLDASRRHAGPGCHQCHAAAVALQLHSVSCSYSREGSERCPCVPRCRHAPQGFSLRVQRPRKQSCRARTTCENDSYIWQALWRVKKAAASASEDDACSWQAW